MGCWSETCIITNLPIEEGDKCVMLLFKLRPGKDPDFPEHGEGMSIADFIISEYDTSWFMTSYFEAIHHGTYNDYGWLNELEKPGRSSGEERGKHLVIFCHAHAWKTLIEQSKESDYKDTLEFYRKQAAVYKFMAAQAKDKTLLALPKTGEDLEIRDMIIFLTFCRRCRINLLSTQGTGLQNTSISAQRLRMKVTREIIKKHRKFY